MKTTKNNDLPPFPKIEQKNNFGFPADIPALAVDKSKAPKKSMETPIEREVITERKVAVTIKLQKTVAMTLKMLAKQYGVSQADLIAILIHGLAMGFNKNQIEDWLDMASKL